MMSGKMHTSVVQRVVTCYLKVTIFCGYSCLKSLRIGTKCNILYAQTKGSPKITIVLKLP